ncbi:hypothetical protein F4810DRAFT_715769 [Camillea tinctor]|nr:hypothetical protein F4810DRAFT_715769 [Camillea tinctor]
MHVIYIALVALAPVIYANPLAIRPSFVNRSRSIDQTESDDFADFPTYDNPPMVLPSAQVTDITTNGVEPFVPQNETSERSTAQEGSSVNLQINDTAPLYESILMNAYDHKIPINKLPECYQACISEHPIGPFGNVYDMSKHQFCHSRHQFRDWMQATLQSCIVKKCRTCGHKCPHQAKHWVRKLCGIF